MAKNLATSQSTGTITAISWEAAKIQAISRRAVEAGAARGEGVEHDRGRGEREHPEPPEAAPENQHALDQADQEREPESPLAQPGAPAALAGLDDGRRRHAGDVTRPPRPPRSRVRRPRLDAAARASERLEKSP